MSEFCVEWDILTDMFSNLSDEEIEEELMDME